MVTTVINLFSSPGAGKSTLAASIFADLKLKGVNCELAREYIKRWAWESRLPSTFEDQLYILGKQSREEAVLYEKVDVIITDSPLFLPAFFEEMFYGTLPDYQNVLTELVNKYLSNLEKVKQIKFLNFWLDKPITYQREGRFETEDESKKIHEKMFDFLNRQNVKLIKLPADHNERMKIVLSYLDLAELTKKID